jgi:hypothetical protein
MSTEHLQYSIYNQSAAIGLYARQHHIEMVKTYADAGKSGLSAENRPGSGCRSPRLAPLGRLILSRTLKRDDARQIANPKSTVASLTLIAESPKLLLAVSPKPSDECHDRNPVKENSMSENVIDSANSGTPNRQLPSRKAKTRPREQSL